MKIRYLIIVGLALAAISLVLAACSSPTPQPTKPPPVVEPTSAVVAVPTQACPEAPKCPEPVVKVVPNQDAWASSPHNDPKAEAFHHWDSATPPEVPVDCAKCHSTTGFVEFMGATGGISGTIAKPVPIGTTIQCDACHSQGAQLLTEVKFPSGAVITGLSQRQVCMECHQGRASKDSVDAAIQKAAVTDDDTVSDKIPFTNIHYFAAAATLYGAQVHGGYEYAGKIYDVKFDHVEGYQTCADCHDSHTTQLKLDACKSCHTNVASTDDLKNIRMEGSVPDYNGNGDTKEGIYFEVKGLQDLLLQAIQAYASEVAKAPIAYSADSYPYFFADANNNGKVDEGETGYKSFTGRLLKAAYNYQTSIKDPGSFAHNGKYIIELLYDSIADLNTKLSKPVDLSKAHRDDAGHFQSGVEQFRHWDAEGEVPGSCAKCHTATGLPTFLHEAAASSDGVTGNNISTHPSSGLNCATCHDDLTKFTRRVVDNVKFPSGAIVTFGKSADANLCIECHQGRESTVSVNAAITRAAAATDDTVSDKLSFRNPHYFAAGATLFGDDAKGAYEYKDQKYSGRFLHVEAMSTCVNCHDTHGLTVQVAACAGCHTTVKSQEDLKNIRMNDTTDYDGNGNNTEGIGIEVDNISAALYAAIQKYAADTAKSPIAYSAASYPYFFADANNNGKVDEGEKAYASWTPRLLRAAYNYQWVNKDPGAFAHNGKYIFQVLYDSLKDLGGDVSKMTRPAVVASPTK